MTERDYLAAELALGLLDGEELVAAHGLAASDADFARQVESWQQQLAPMLDTIGAQTPPEQLWDRIAAELSARPEGGAQIAVLQRRLRTWQRAAAVSAIAACALALVVLSPILAPRPPETPEAPLVASFTLPSTPARLGVTWLPAQRDLLVDAAGLPGDGVHDHELWLVPPEGKTISLGLVAPDKSVRLHLPDDLAARLRDGATLALTREPLGGSQGRPAGPIVSTTKFSPT
ncbi:anti-sigma factor [Novosphingobium aquae]|uniref:Anti-sigma factor n=1 Tax=Novosphingobium aquae TaxID=3133435 RepID=A0ABU8S994_9SPHN